MVISHMLSLEIPSESWRIVNVMTFLLLVTSILQNFFFQIINLFLKVRHRVRHCEQLLFWLLPSHPEVSDNTQVSGSHSHFLHSWTRISNCLLDSPIWWGSSEAHYVSRGNPPSFQISMFYPTQFAPFSSLSTIPPTTNKKIFLNHNTQFATLIWIFQWLPISKIQLPRHNISWWV